MKALVSSILLGASLFSFVLPVTTFAKEIPKTPQKTTVMEQHVVTPTQTLSAKTSDTNTEKQEPLVNQTDTSRNTPLLPLAKAPSGETTSSEPTKTPAIDSRKILTSFQGKQEVDLFSGALSYAVPIPTPPGRGGVEPNLSLLYSSLNQSFGSSLGYGWSLPTNAIFRSPTRGVNTTYVADEFSADIFGGTNELVLVNAQDHRYAAKTESSFTSYAFTGTSWTAVDRSGTTYTFGSSSDARQSDPKDDSHVYKWLLERVEDANGNAMVFEYTSNGKGAVYPSVIFYGGTGKEDAPYKIQFTLTDRPQYTDYRTGFSVTHTKLVSDIDVFFLANSSEEHILNEHFSYTSINNAVQLISEITVSAGDVVLPSTKFTYYNGSEETTYKKLHTLYRVEEGEGATHTFTYTPSTAYRKGNGTSTNLLPFTVYTVSAYTTKALDDAESFTTTYRYEHGHYFSDPQDAFLREYAGFGKVTITDPLEFKTINYYHQSETDPENEENADLGEFEDHIAKKGRLYRAEQYDESGNLARVSLTTWQGKELPDADEQKARTFVYPSQTSTLTYLEDGSHEDTAITYTYDAFGNILNESNFGEVQVHTEDFSFTDSGTDTRISTHTYATDPDGEILSAPSSTTITDTEGMLVAKTLSFYDDLSYGSVETGNKTKEQTWITDDSFSTSAYTYDAFGNVLTQTDPLNHVTTYTYDAFNLYPETITNALGHVKTFVYDYRIGKPKQMIEVNGAITERDYDGFGRPLLERKTGDNDTLQTTETWDYNDTSSPRSITHHAYLSSSLYTEDITYIDGFGRSLETKTLDEDGDYNESETTYDALQRIASTTLPEKSASSAYDKDTVSQAIVETYAYDALGRVTSVTNVLGTTTTTYSGFTSKTVTDALHNQKTYINDGLGRLTSVTEYIDDAPYTTSYIWSGGDTLVQITDALGNVRNFTYDGRGLRLTAEDLHAVSDTTYGIWTDTYDAAGNKIFSLSPNGTTISYVYDALNRITSEDALDTPEVESTYTYDTCTNGTGLLCNISVNSGASKQMTYEPSGRVETETRTIDSISYQTAYTYDTAGNPLTITHPDGTVVRNAYNALGRLEHVEKKTPTDADFTSIVLNNDYGSHGHVVLESLGNGTETTYTYDPSARYRLTDKETTGYRTEIPLPPALPSVVPATLQHLSYTYDAVGNITKIVDSSETDAAKTTDYVYDDLYRLTSATVSNSFDTSNETISFSYNILGNITYRSDMGTYAYEGSLSDSYANPHAVTSILKPDGTTDVFSYDNNGNMTENGTTSYTWDYKNRLIFSTITENTVTYAYDEGMQRIKKMSPSSTTIYPSSSYNTDGNKTTVYINRTSGSTATVTFDGTTYSTDTIHTDHLGSTSVVTDEGGSMVELLDYHPYGTERLNWSSDSSGEADSQKTYIGEYSDDETDLSYLNARYYDPARGQFLSEDSVFVNVGAGHMKDTMILLADPQQQNSYLYARGNPVSFVDPEGRSIMDALKQTVFGNYYQGSFSLGGLALQIGLGLIGVDLPGDIRDITYDVTHSVPGWQTGIDAISLVPFIGILKYSDEAAGFLRGAGKTINKLDNITVKSFGQTIYQGSRDLNPTLDAISNKSISGKTFYNDPFNGSRLLPTKTDKYYTEYDVIDTPNWSSSNRGPERIIMGQNGEKYYSPDHFKTIQKVD